MKYDIYIKCLLITYTIINISARAASLHESANIGETNQNGGAGINMYNYMGSRFYLQDSSIVTRVGGHMGSALQDFTFFAAIVALDGPTSLPRGNPFSSDEVIAVTNFSMGIPGFPSFELMIPLRATLPSGWYGLVFGGGYYFNPQFGAYGSGIMPYNNNDLPGASYFSWSGTYPQLNSVWQQSSFTNLRFIV